MESRTRVGDYARLDFDATFTELQHFTGWTLSCYSPGGVYPNVLWSSDLRNGVHFCPVSHFSTHMGTFSQVDDSESNSFHRIRDLQLTHSPTQLVTMLSSDLDSTGFISRMHWDLEIISAEHTISLQKNNKVEVVVHEIRGNFYLFFFFGNKSSKFLLYMWLSHSFCCALQGRDVLTSHGRDSATVHTLAACDGRCAVCTTFAAATD